MCIRERYGIENIAMHCRADMIDKFVIVRFHTLFDPVQHAADETVFIKIGDKFCGVLGTSGYLCLLPDDLGNQRVGQRCV